MSQRINVVVSDEQHAMLMAMAKLQGRSAASYLREMLDVATPVLLVSLPLLLASVDGLGVHSAAVSRSASMFAGALETAQPLLDSASVAIADALALLKARDEEDGTRMPNAISSPARSAGGEGREAPLGTIAKSNSHEAANAS